ncbi:hypothetical protein ACJX0J_037476, partial [Zea mays]
KKKRCCRWSLRVLVLCFFVFSSGSSKLEYKHKEAGDIVVGELGFFAIGLKLCTMTFWTGKKTLMRYAPIFLQEQLDVLDRQCDIFQRDNLAGIGATHSTCLSDTIAYLLPFAFTLYIVQTMHDYITCKGVRGLPYDEHPKIIADCHGWRVIRTCHTCIGFSRHVEKYYHPTFMPGEILKFLANELTTTHFATPKKQQAIFLQSNHYKCCVELPFSEINAETRGITLLLRRKQEGLPCS